MSAHVVAEVFRRYPRGGAEKLLALAIADQAADDGRVVIGEDMSHLARAAHVPAAAVPDMLAAMVAAGWLEAPVKGATGPASSCGVLHRISAVWLASSVLPESAGGCP